jgi:hypothetical protein
MLKKPRRSLKKLVRLLSLSKQVAEERLDKTLLVYCLRGAGLAD